MNRCPGVQKTNTDIMNAFRELMDPAQNEMRALVVPNDDPLVRGFSSFLSKQQRARCRRFHIADDRRAAAISKGLWRIGAGVLLGCDPRSVEIEFDEWKRPILQENERTEVDLNVSRTRTYCALVIARGTRVGVDVEEVNPHLINESVVRLVEQSSARRGDLLGSPGAFFQLWTNKEAVMKGDGRGLTLDPLSIESSASDEAGGVWSLCGSGQENWYTRPLDCPGPIRGSVASDSGTSRLIQIGWDQLKGHGDMRESCAHTHVMNP